MKKWTEQEIAFLKKHYPNKGKMWCAQLFKTQRAKAAKSGTASPRKNVTWKSGWRTIGGKRKYYRSKWEANYARYLEWLKQRKSIADWQYEPETFWFNEIKRGCVSYLPDFKVIENNGKHSYHEVKGWMDDRSKTKLRRMAKYYPEETLVLIESVQYKAISRQVGRIIDGWE